VTSDHPTDEDLDALLARGKLGAGVRDRILESVLDGLPVGPAKRRPWVWRVPVALGTLAAATAVFLVVAPRLIDHRQDLRAKGAPGAGVELDVACPAAALEACPQGATLVFGVGGQADGFLSAYAEPRDGGERVWYFSADAESPRVHAVGATTPLSRAIRVGAEHTTGVYVVHVLLTREALTRAELVAGPAAAGVVARRDFELRVTASDAPGGAPHGR
jgi:hypothetical protein